MLVLIIYYLFIGLQSNSNGMVKHRQIAGWIHVYLLFHTCILTHTHTHTHRVHASAKLPSQQTSLTAFGCHDDDEVRGLGVEFDPD